jgi:hypothetical protein
MPERWERQPGEPSRAFHAFAHYRDGGSQRSLDRAWREHHATCLKTPQPVTRRRPPSWGNWSARWSWVARADAFDAHLAHQKQAALEQEQVEAARRHARALQAAMSAMTVPVRLALELAATPEGLAKLRAAATDAVGLRGVLADARMAAAHLPALVTAERLTLGMSTERTEVEAKPVDLIAQAIVADPETTSMAVDLLARIAKVAAPAVESAQVQEP